MPQEMQDLTLVEVGLSLGDIARDRNSRPADLIREAVHLPLRKLFRGCIDFNY